MLQLLFQRASLPAIGTRAFATAITLAILGCATPVAGKGDGAAPANAAGAQTAQDAASDGDAVPDVNLSGALLYQLMAAEVAAQRGDIGAAYATYLKLARETRDPRLARRATELALQGRALAESLEAAKLWHELAPRSSEATQAVAMLYAASGKFDESYALFSEQLKTTAQPAEELARIQRALTRSQDRAGAFVLLERLAQPFGKTAEVRLVLANGAQAAGLNARAIEEAKAAVDLAPDSERAALTAAQYMQATDRKGALALLARYLERQPKSSDGRLAYARLLIADKQYDTARGQFERLLQADPKNPDLVYSMALLSMQGNLKADARRYLDRYLALLEEPGNEERDADNAYLNLAQLAEEDKQYGEALKWLRKVEGGEEYVQARVREAAVLAKMDKLEEGRKVLREIKPRSEDERVQLVIAEAQLLRDAKRQEESYAMLAQALEKSPDSLALLYDTAMAAERTDRLVEMERHLRRVIELKPDYAHAYNALGYTFADRSTRLPEALQLIEKANQLSPDDPYILDSLGWVHFRMGDLKRAREVLERAYNAKPEAEVAIHLAEVLWASGDQDGARKLLREVRTQEPGNELLKSTLARLKIAL
ncbi:MAG TPA: tetratricopeptide repeat protein [Burkholderiaceae bacterium]|nr:tetratricopeptide repeat protein [Burkholderiaceae bacterium]